MNFNATKRKTFYAAHRIVLEERESVSEG